MNKGNETAIPQTDDPCAFLRTLYLSFYIYPCSKCVNAEWKMDPVDVEVRPTVYASD